MLRLPNQTKNNINWLSADYITLSKPLATPLHHTALFKLICPSIST